MEGRWMRDFGIVAGIAMIAFSLLAWVAHTVGFIAVAGGQGWDGSVFVSVIREITGGVYSNSDPYRAIRTVAFPVIYVVEYFGLDMNIVHAQRAVNVTLMVASTCMLFATARLKGVGRGVALLTAATFLFAWGVLVVPVFTPVLTDHLAIFTSSLSLFLWASGRRGGLLVLVLACVWVMPTAALVPLALLAMRDEQLGERGLRIPAWINPLFLLAAVAVCGAVYLWKGPGLLEGVDTHVFDFSRNPEGELTGSVKLLPLSILVVVAMLFLCIRATALFLAENWKVIDLKGLIGGGVVALVSFAVMRALIDFDKGFAAGQLFNNISKQALSAPLKTWVAHTAYFGPAVLVTYCFIVFRRAVLPAPLELCLIGFMPLLALGSESRQWIAVLPCVVLALGFLSLSIRSRVVLMLSTFIMFWGVWGLNDRVNLAVSSNVGLQDPLWFGYMGRVGPWMTMSVYRHWLLLSVLTLSILLLVELLPRLRKTRLSELLGSNG